MIIVKGNDSRKIENIWDVVKKEHSGNKVAIVSHKGGIPHNFVRGKQMHAYETLATGDLVQEVEQFMQSIRGRFEAVVLYVNCEHHFVESIKELAEKYQQKVFLTVHDEETILAIENY